MGERCQADELQTLFLFEHLTDAQLEVLCKEGRIETFPSGPLFFEGEPSKHLYVLIDGELVMSARSGNVDVQVHRTSQRGVYCGAWSAYVPEAAPVYEASIRLTQPSRFYVLDADRFAHFMQSEFPMAVHLLAGHTMGGLRQQQLVGQRARLVALGTITAGLTHQLNNPAAAIARAAAGLRDTVGKLRHSVATAAEQRLAPESLRTLVAAQDDAAAHVGTSKSQEISPLEFADREEQLFEWFDANGISKGWDSAPTFVEAGVGADWLQRVSMSVTTAGDQPDAGTLGRAVEWLKDTIDAELRMREIAEASKRISALLAGAKQYSQMDRGAYQLVDIHELLRSTIMMFEDRIGTSSSISVVTEWARDLPEISCYAGDLNQLWTNLIDNALEAMGGDGTLTLRTMRDGDSRVRVEICDTGPGIADGIIDHIFTPFFTTKPVGEGTGLGLDLAWRIVDQHGGNLSVLSRPADTRFIVCLPLQAPARELPPAGDLPVIGQGNR